MSREEWEGRIGSVLSGKWRLDRLIDVGGMAAVYAATHRNGKRVAIKMLHARLGGDAAIRARFLREGYLANAVDHPGAVSVTDDETTPDGLVFLVMELLDGESLQQLLARRGGRLELREVLIIADRVLDVLEAAHAKKIVHRDLKPANLFLTRSGSLKVLDFGLARLHDGRVAPTAHGIVLGTSAYMPPEQALGHASSIDGRSDLFALGAVMFRALTGRTVHLGEGNGLIIAAATKVAPPLASLLPDLHHSVAHLVDRALAFEQAERWPTAHAMRGAVREVLKDPALLTEPLGGAPAGPSAAADSFVEVSLASVVLVDAASDELSLSSAISVEAAPERSRK